jgi:NADPH:quinone reductase-like Zn-dependent oxidoreductase
MEVYEIQNFGIEGLDIVDRPAPEPGARQVLVKMHAWSLNYRHLMTITGRYNPKLKLPQIPLSDGAGEIVATGSDVEGFKGLRRNKFTFWRERQPPPRLRLASRACPPSVTGMARTSSRSANAAGARPPPRPAGLPALRIANFYVTFSHV